MSRLSAEQQTQVRELLAHLVGILSVNENAAQGNRDQSEREIADYLEGHLERMGMTVTRYRFMPGRDNLVAHWPDQAGRRSFALQAHMDTVGAQGMTVDPFGAEIHDGRMWGRGTCDTKGSMAAFLTALAIARQSGQAFQDKIYFVATVAEETGCRGADALVKAGFTVDAIVAGEPTMSKLVTAHKGAYWARLESVGRSAHASVPQEGHNAIYAMSRAMDFIENEYIPTLGARSHPLLGSPTLSVGTIQGGTATNIVPEACSAGLDFRLLPADEPEEVRADFIRRLDQTVAGEQFSLSTVHAQKGVDTPVDSPWVGNLLGVCERVAGQTAPQGVNYYADSGPFHEGGITCVLFGPGDIAQAHTADEFLDLEQLYLTTEITLEWLKLAAKQSLIG